MCEPTTIAYVVMAVAAVMKGKQDRQQGRFQNKVAKFNARQQENEAVNTRNAGVKAENKQRRATAELIARQRAQLGAANIELGSGSAFQLQDDAATLGEVDALTIRDNFENRASALDSGSTLSLAKGANAESAGQQSFNISLLSAAGTAGLGASGTTPAAGVDAGAGGMGATATTGPGGVAGKWFTPESAAFIA